MLLYQNFHEMQPFFLFFLKKVFLCFFFLFSDISHLLFSVPVQHSKGQNQANCFCWIRILRQCREIHADVFTAALFRIGQKYLTFDPVLAGYPKEWQEIQVDEQLMLDDLLDAGIYGDGTMSRKHSSNITLNAVSAQKQGKRRSILF